MFLHLRTDHGTAHIRTIGLSSTSKFPRQKARIFHGHVHVIYFTRICMTSGDIALQSVLQGMNIRRNLLAWQKSLEYALEFLYWRLFILKIQFSLPKSFSLLIHSIVSKSFNAAACRNRLISMP